MGCTQSKIENEEAVTRCKDRKQFMKEAVAARNAFAAAHSAYAMSLKNTGAALSDYAHGEVQNPELVTTTSHQSASSASAAAAAQHPSDPLLPPPPPPSLTPPPIQRASSMPEMKMAKGREHANGVGPTIAEENDGDDEEEEIESDEKLIMRKRSSGRNKSGDSQRQGRQPPQQEQAPPPAMENSGSVQAVQDWDYWFPPVESIPRPSLEVKEEEEKATVESKVLEETPEREENMVEKLKEVPPPPPPVVEDVAEEEREAVMAAEAGGGSVGRNVKRGKSVSGLGEKRAVKGTVNLLQVFVELDDHFLKASESAHEVSKMLEATRLHYHSNFADNRGHIDHSARVMRVITWNRSFRGLPMLDEVKDDFDSEENETHATVLDKLLAWEKKLYDEVKAGELMKLDYQRKVASLNKQKKRGTNSEALEKIKAAVSHLHTRYVVDMQSMDSTVLEINRLRDEQLYPKLVQLVDGMALMWGTMQFHHKSQSKIVVALKLLDISQSPKETTEHHHERTIQLWAVVQEWNSQYCKLIDHQKEYIKALNSWLKLNLVPIESNLREKVSSPPRIQTPPVQRLLFAWQDHLEKLPDEIARGAISNFAALINTIMHHQEEEMKLKERCEETRKELARKTRQFEDWYNKYMQRRTAEELDADGTTLQDAVAERKFTVDVLKKRLEEEEEAYQRQCVAVREKSLNSLRNHLPELFKAMTEISFACAEMYKALRNIAQRQKPGQSSS